MAPLPNIELTSFFVIMFTVYFGYPIFFIIPVFTAVEVLLFGFGPWVFMYLYVWPILAAVTLFFRKSDSSLTYALLSALFGFAFGFLCSFTHMFISADGGAGSLSYALSWWVTGIPWDILHGVSNFIIMLVLYKPISHTLKHVDNWIKK